MTETIEHRSGCPLASALDLVGDKWSLIIVRGMFVGHTRYNDFLNGPEKISTNILAQRLRHLECTGLIERLQGDAASVSGRYRLTRRGADLLPILQAMAKWGYENIDDRWRPPKWFLRARPADFYPKTK
jgi:DNA-binding HxlR family transcriptional regulator